MRRLAAGAFLALLGCTSGEFGPPAAATIDTLPSGALHVTSAPEGLWFLTDAEPWRLVEDLRIGSRDEEGPFLFGRPGSVIPDEMGRIWVLDGQAFELRLFDAEGRFVRTVGRQGDGPGEFAFNPCAFPGPGDEVWVESGRRWQRFDTAGAFLGGQPSRSNVGCGIRQWLPGGRFLAVNADYDPVTRETTAYFVEYRMEASGALTPADTFPWPTLPPAPRVELTSADGRSTIGLRVPFAAQPNGLLGPTGDFWVTDGGGTYRIRRQSLTGDTLLVIEKPFEPISIPDSIRAREIEGLHREGYTIEEAFDPDDVPRRYPPFDRYLVDGEGTLWVFRHGEGGAQALDVFAPDGRFLGPVDPPPGLEDMLIQRVTPDHMYGLLRDELDVPYVVRLAILKPGE